MVTPNSWQGFCFANQKKQVMKGWLLMKGMNIMHILKSIAASAVSLALITTIFAGCSKSPAPSASSEAPPSTVSNTSTPDENTLPLMEKMTIAMASHPNVEDYNTNYFTQKIAKDSNIAIEFVLLPADKNDAKTKFSLMVSSNSSLPDVLNMNIGDMTAFDYASKGIFVKLNDYYTNPELATNILNISQSDREHIYKSLMLPDGNVYSLFNYGPSDWNSARYRLWINQAWLDKLKLPIPKTTDEYHQTLKAFLDNDANGNGKRDEIGVVGSKDGWGQQPFPFIMNAFIYNDPTKGYINVDESGQLYASYTKPEWKAGLEYMYKLCQEGLLSPLSFTQDYTQLSALINMKGGVAGSVASGSGSTFGEEITKDMMLMEPLKGPSGVQYTTFLPALPNDFWYITKDCKNPEQAFAIGDSLLNYESFTVGRYGEPDVDWTADPKACEEYLGTYELSDGVKPKLITLNNIWSKPQNKHWQGSNPAYLSSEDAKALATLGKKSEAADIVNFTQLHTQMYMPHIPENAIPKIMYNQEEREKIADMKTNIDAYAYDTAVAFITGNKPISEWDSYLNELEKMGLAEYMAVSQTAYDRSYK